MAVAAASTAVLAVGACAPAESPVVDRFPGPGAVPMDPVYASPGASTELKALVDAQNRRDARPLFEGLRSGGEEVAARSAFALASVQERGAEPALAARLDDPRPPVAAAAAFALGRMGSERAAEALLGALSSSPGVESIGQVIRSLGLTMGESQLERFLALDRMEGELAEAVMAVARAGVGGQMNGEGLAWLAEHLSHPAEEVRVAAAYYFSRAPDAGEWRGVAEAVRTALAAL
ncbi:MAG: HEAT repeat domain-containing protein, partial [Gemmatimonadetes bacterium]|nr:HEAT repeat domain-containing protein [Gemmatimonadota bacterium]